MSLCVGVAKWACSGPRTSSHIVLALEAFKRHVCVSRDTCEGLGRIGRGERGCGGGQVLRLRLLTAGRPADLRLDLRPARALRRAEAALAAGAHRRACRSRDGHGSALLRVRVRPG